MIIIIVPYLQIQLLTVIILNIAFMFNYVYNYVRKNNHHWAAVVSHGWAKASACCLQITLSCAVLCQIMSLQYLSRSSLHRLAGLPCRLFLSCCLQVVTREVHRSSLRRWICPAQDHFIFLTLLIISMTTSPLLILFSHSLCADVGYCH